MKLYNTLTRKIEPFKTIKPGFVGMYTCGMTVYDHTHIGNMRTYVNTDLLRRTLEYNGFKVKQVENITDVGHLTSDADTGEDKLQKKAREQRKTAWEIAKIYTQEFFETMDVLNVLRPHVIAPATEHIQEMIQLIQELEKKGFTYIIPDDGVYFNTSKLSDYGKLASLDIKGLKPGARVKMTAGKKNITDFALWKFSQTDEKRDMEWESPWAKRSYPGWHIECSALVMKYLSHAFDQEKFDPESFETIDLHTGGIDHIPVHHTNEIAQTEAATGKKFVNFWFHNEFMIVEDEKMSKSLGNFFWIEDIKQRGFNPLTLRYLFLTAHYRSKLNFTWEGLNAAQQAYQRLVEMLRTWQQEKLGTTSPTPRTETAISDLRKKFQEKINHDLNIPEALAVVWQIVKSKIPNPSKLDLILDFDQVLGLGLAELGEIAIPAEVKKLVQQREKLRGQKKWLQADAMREKIEKLGWKIEDSKKGRQLKPLSQKSYRRHI